MAQKRTTCFRVLQYAGGIVMVFSLLVGAAAMFAGYYEHKMIQVVRAIKDIKQGKAKWEATI